MAFHEMASLKGMRERIHCASSRRPHFPYKLMKPLLRRSSGGGNTPVEMMWSWRSLPYNRAPLLAKAFKAMEMLCFSSVHLMALIEWSHFTLLAHKCLNILYEMLMGPSWLYNPNLVRFTHLTPTYTITITPSTPWLHIALSWCQDMHAPICALIHLTIIGHVDGDPNTLCSVDRNCILSGQLWCVVVIYYIHIALFILPQWKEYAH